jgi:cyclopropane fatty-acyl-phospholipid synthase-like methyltransferase
VVIKINNKIIDDKIVYPTHWFYTSLSLRDDELVIEVYENNKLEYIKTITLNETNLEQIKEKGLIEFN